MKKRVVLMSFFAMSLAVTSVFGQGLTNSGINGQITDDKGETMPGATVLAVHQLSGTQYGTVSDNSGYFTCLSLRWEVRTVISPKEEGSRIQKRW